MALPQWALLNSARRMSDAQGALRSNFLVDGATYNLFLGTRKGLRYLERVVITDGMTITIPD